ncbi:hypothetical protein RUM43_006048 [Polyplax serrata]|uniref:Uncharacterized protein n=1 Tax=Polyplax serrata TaxID=468196 RepID=A0AAN8S8X6_POLSC
MDSDHCLTDTEVLLSDFCSKSNKKVVYTKRDDHLSLVEVESSCITPWDSFQYLGSLIKDIFLPKGYPYSVSSDYLEYQIWDTCQAFCSSISGTLTVQAIMEGIGVGSKAATPVSAAITWIMKDGTGMLGSILFAWLKGSKLDSDCKKWRLFADVLNDIAMFIELFIPLFINYSMHMLCIATAFKALVGTAGSSTRAALITHQAVKGNIADVSAKDGSQELFTNLFAFVWSVMCTATLFHLIFNYKAVRCLRMNVFNGERFRLSLRSYLPTSSVPTIEQVNRRESVILGGGTSDCQLCGFSIIFGASVRKVVVSERMSGQYLSTLVAAFQHRKYLILPQIKRKKIFVTFRTNFSDCDVLPSYFHAIILGIVISKLQADKNLHVIRRSRKNSPMYRLQNILEGVSSAAVDSKSIEDKYVVIAKALTICDNFIEKEFAAFSQLCSEEGWTLEKHLINVDEWRADWKYSPEKQKMDFYKTNIDISILLAEKSTYSAATISTEKKE